MENGAVAAKGAGVAIITATRGGQTAQCVIAVEKKFGKIADSEENVSVNDAVLLLQSASGSASLSDEQKALADVNGDGKADVNDAIVLLRYVAGLEDRLTD